MIAVGARLGDHVDGSAFRAAIFCGEALGADLEFLHGFERKLHDGTADGVVFVIDTVDGDVDVATTVSVDGKNRVTVFGGIVRIGSFNTGSEISEIGDVATEKRKLFNFTGSDVLADAGLGDFDEWGLGSDFDSFRTGADLEFDVGGNDLANHNFDGLRGGGETALGDGNDIVADGEEFEAVVASVVGGGGASKGSFFTASNDLRADDCGLRLIHNGTLDSGRSRDLSEQVAGS